MKNPQQVVVMCGVAFLGAVAMAACGPDPTSSRYSGEGPQQAVQCDSLLSSVIQRQRTGDTSGAINGEMDSLSTNCSAEYDIAVDYVSEANTTRGPKSCDSLREFKVRPEAVELLREDGFCTSDNGTSSVGESWPNGGLGWDNAEEHAGTYQRVCGPLASMRNTYDGVFVNLGRDYPSTDRFTFIVWGAQLEPIETDTTICASGNVYLYEGVTQVELSSPNELEIWK